MLSFTAVECLYCVSVRNAQYIQFILINMKNIHTTWKIHEFHHMKYSFCVFCPLNAFGDFLTGKLRNKATCERRLGVSWACRALQLPSTASWAWADFTPPPAHTLLLCILSSTRNGRTCFHPSSRWPSMCHVASVSLLCFSN